MHSVSEEQIDFILDDITKRGVITEDVRDNILDHVCCIIENEMPNGENFFKFYENTIARFYRKELREIERETEDLITFKYYYAMKRTLKISGVTSGFLILLGSIFKVLHLQGAGVLLVLGLALFSLVFLPLNAVLKFRDNKDDKNPMLLSLGMLIMAVSCIGVLFKIMQWPFASIIIQGSIAAFVLFYIPVYFVTRSRNADTKFNGTINAIFMMAVCGMLYALTTNHNSSAANQNMANMDSFLLTNVKTSVQENEDLYEGFVAPINEDVERLHVATEALSNQLMMTRANLVATGEHIAIEEAKWFDKPLRDPFGLGVVEQTFVYGEGEYSYTNLVDAIQAYNKVSKELTNNIVDLEAIQLKNVFLSVLLHNLTQVQYEILTNENSFLYYEKGRVSVTG